MKFQFNFLLFALVAVLVFSACKSKRSGDDLLAILDASECSCVVSNNGIITTYNQKGVRDLYDLLTTQPQVLKGAHVADKIIGKGAAALLVSGGVERVTTHVITTPALRMLRDAGIEVDYEKEIPYVENRKKTGQCPLDARLQKTDSAHLALPVISRFLEDLSRDSSSVFLLKGDSL